MIEYFWLIMALWVGVGNGLIIWWRRRTFIERGGFTEEEVARLAKGAALGITVPALIFFLLQASIDGKSEPAIWTWPSPQKQVGCAVDVLWLLTFALWVFRGGGATTLASYLTCQMRKPSSLITPTTMKLVAVVCVIANMLTIWLSW